MTRVKVNVSGTVCEFDRGILKAYDSHKLSKLCEERSRHGKPLDFTFDRPSAIFVAILSYYQTGELHIPTGVCPVAFRRELEYWGVESNSLHDCCRYRYQAFVDEEETRRTFLQRSRSPPPSVIQITPTVPLSVVGKVRKFRSRLWNIVDRNENSVMAKVYFVAVMAAVLLSIFSMAYSTEPCNRRTVNQCELLEYMVHTEDDRVEQLKTLLEHPDCTDPTQTKPLPMNVPFLDNTFKFIMQPKNRTGLRDIFNGFVQAADNIGDDEETIEVPHLTVPKDIFRILDTVVTALFTVDLILRIWSCPSVFRYFLSLINLVDALALVCCYVYVIVLSIEKQYKYNTEETWVILLQYTQVLRSLRFFRAVKNVRASRVLAYSITQCMKDMTLLVTLLLMGISSFACLFYFAESRETIPSIPVAWYWAVVTMTTVGYGDISPKTGVGRFISSVCAICGVLLIAVTLPMFVNHFLTLYQYSCVNDSIEKQDADDTANEDGKNQEFGSIGATEEHKAKSCKCEKLPLPS